MDKASDKADKFVDKSFDKVQGKLDKAVDKTSTAVVGKTDDKTVTGEIKGSVRVYLY